MLLGYAVTLEFHVLQCHSLAIVAPGSSFPVGLSSLDGRIAGPQSILFLKHKAYMALESRNQLLDWR